MDEKAQTCFSRFVSTFGGRYILNLDIHVSHEPIDILFDHLINKDPVASFSGMITIPEQIFRAVFTCTTHVSVA